MTTTLPSVQHFLHGLRQTRQPAALSGGADPPPRRDGRVGHRRRGARRRRWPDWCWRTRRRRRFNDLGRWVHHARIGGYGGVWRRRQRHGRGRWLGHLGGQRGVGIGVGRGACTHRAGLDVQHGSPLWQHWQQDQRDFLAIGMPNPSTAASSRQALDSGLWAPSHMTTRSTPTETARDGCEDTSHGSLPDALPREERPRTARTAGRRTAL